ncbi:MAG TPA: group 1 truncated hemoglobin [Ignavibacteriaceae bacterium]|nr:group 1 truncated hemoglobin [Ignavibacteriaceae bacterium]
MSQYQNPNRGIIFIILTVILFLGNLISIRAQEKSLYERLGGVKPISLVVDDFINRLVANDILNANPMIKEGRKHSPDAYLKFQVTNLVCQVTGGPCVYTGLGMKESHTHMNITENEWQVMRDEFKKTLDKFQVPEKEQKELFDVVESTKKDIVMVE